MSIKCGGNKIRWTFENIYKDGNIDPMEESVESEIFEFGGRKWKILIGREYPKIIFAHLAYASENLEDDTWHANVYGKVEVLKQKENAEDYVKEFREHLEIYNPSAITVFFDHENNADYYLTETGDMTIEVEFSFAYYDRSLKRRKLDDVKLDDGKKPCFSSEMFPLQKTGNKVCWTFDNIYKNEDMNDVESEIMQINGFKWKITIGKDLGRMIFIRLHYCSENEKDGRWFAQVTGKIRILKQNEKAEDLVQDLSDFIDSDFSNTTDPFFESGENPDDYLTKYNEMTIEIEFDFVYHDFAVKIGNGKDIKLLVEDKPFYFTKEYLISNLKYFRNLFVERKSEKQNFVVKSVSVDDFRYFLSYLDPQNTCQCIPVKSLMMLEKRFGSEIVHKKMENHLLTDTSSLLTSMDRIILAINYDYNGFLAKYPPYIRQQSELANLKF